jgi:hypothetical protein
VYGDVTTTTPPGRIRRPTSAKQRRGAGKRSTKFAINTASNPSKSASNAIASPRRKSTRAATTPSHGRSNSNAVRRTPSSVRNVRTLPASRITFAASINAPDKSTPTTAAPNRANSKLAPPTAHPKSNTRFPSPKSARKNPSLTTRPTNPKPSIGTGLPPDTCSAVP